MIAKWYLAAAWLVTLGLIIVHETRRGGASVTPMVLTTLVNRDEGVVLDVRPNNEFRAGHIVDSINIPHTAVASQISDLEKYRDRPLVVVCKLGQQSGAVARTLKDSGFERVYKLGGGIAEWQHAQLPLVKA